MSPVSFFYYYYLFPSLGRRVLDFVRDILSGATCNPGRYTENKKYYGRGNFRAAVVMLNSSAARDGGR